MFYWFLKWIALGPVLKLVFRHLVTERSTGWVSGHRIDWEAPVS